ncbi:MAG: hypothetical protein DMF85_19790, partial [Acidobacteria bacterium]
MRRRVFIFRLPASVFCLSLACLALSAQAPSTVDSQTFLQQQLGPPPALKSADAQRVRDLVAQMTLKEKVGQMTQLEIGMVADGRDGDLRINPAKLRKAIVDYGVGAVLNVK